MVAILSQPQYVKTPIPWHIMNDQDGVLSGPCLRCTLMMMERPVASDKTLGRITYSNDHPGIQYSPGIMYMVLLCFVLLWSCNVHPHRYGKVIRVTALVVTEDAEAWPGQLSWWSLHFSAGQELCTWFCCALFCCGVVITTRTYSISQELCTWFCFVAVV